MDDRRRREINTVNTTKKAAFCGQPSPGQRAGHKDVEGSEPLGKLTRRDLLGRAAYVGPALTVFGTIRSLPVGAASLGAPPPPPGTQSDIIRMEYRLLQQEQVPAGPDPLELFTGDPEN